MNADVRIPTQREIDIAMQILKVAGYVVVKEGSYRRAQTRQAVADARAVDAQERERANDAWWREHILPELFRYRDRVEFLYGAARAHGATIEELSGDAQYVFKEAGTATDIDEVI